ncbi:MAG: glycosyl hydrolase family 62 [Deltaproteobacteria bacterium]|nr:glycosyl hydrolase family 62 [Deltaproteobacteria bacterium]
MARVVSLALAGVVLAISGCDSGDGGGSRGICSGANDAGGPSVGLPSKFWWTSSPALIPPPSGALSIKDPSVLFFDNKWHIYATAYISSYTMVYLDFADWADAGTAPQVLMSTNPNLTGYKCAPQVFYFAPSATWYLIYQTQEPAYSTSTNPSDVDSWSAMTRFMSMPSIIENSQTGGIDYWVICDDVHCHMFFSADNGALYRNQTAKADFPNGFDPNATVIVMQASQSFDLFEASNVYRIEDQNQYLLIVEALGKGRYFRSWTSDRLDGTWTPLADSQSTPFAGYANVAGADWSNDGISHGEMLRDNPDETMTIEASCNMRYLFQGRTRAGKNADGSDNYELNEYSLGLLTPAW